MALLFPDVANRAVIRLIDLKLLFANSLGFVESSKTERSPRKCGEVYVVSEISRFRTSISSRPKACSCRCTVAVSNAASLLAV